MRCARARSVPATADPTTRSRQTGRTRDPRDMSAHGVYDRDDLDFMPDVHAATRHRGRRFAYILTVLSVVFFGVRSEEHTSELQSLMRISYAVFCLQKKNKQP